MDKLTMSVEELSESLGIGRNQAYQLTRSEGFPCVHVGTRILIPMKEFQEWLTAQSLQPATGLRKK
jgi:excisionase family DNA binding protein